MTRFLVTIPLKGKRYGVTAKDEGQALQMLDFYGKGMLDKLGEAKIGLVDENIKVNVGYGNEVFVETLPF